jgi:FkbM family methyltransferase
MLKSFIKTAFRRAGVEIIRVNKPSDTFGLDAITDTRRLLPTIDSPMIFDVGANRGQTVERLLRLYPAPLIHCFEPSPSTFHELRAAYGEYPNIAINNLGLGANPCTLELAETSVSEYSSFLEPGSAEVTVVGRSSVPVSTVDAYCSKNGIGTIDILKSDTQGFDYQVLRGADVMFTRGAVKLVVCELTMDDSYTKIDRFDQMFSFMAERGFQLFGVYDQHWRHNRLSWADVMFIRHDFATM